MGQEFETISKTRDTIKSIIIDAGLSYKKLKSNHMCYLLVCKDNTCMLAYFFYMIVLKYIGSFRIRVLYLRRLGITRITIYKPYTYSFVTHTNFRQLNTVSYTLSYHINSISQDRNLKPRHITNQERLQYSNQLSY